MKVLPIRCECRCRLLHPIRDPEGHTHFGEEPTILREMQNLDRRMFLVEFENGTKTFVFPHEIAFSSEIRLNDLSGHLADIR